MDEQFHKRLQTGYRMERPPRCPQAVYELMGRCWLLEPHLRPSFEQLTSLLYELLDQSTQNSYINIVGELAERARDSDIDF